MVPEVMPDFSMREFIRASMERLTNALLKLSHAYPHPGQYPEHRMLKSFARLIPVEGPWTCFMLPRDRPPMFTEARGRGNGPSTSVTQLVGSYLW
jgi:hypothetical protein